MRNAAIVCSVFFVAASVHSECATGAANALVSCSALESTEIRLRGKLSIATDQIILNDEESDLGDTWIRGYFLTLKTPLCADVHGDQPTPTPVTEVLVNPGEVLSEAALKRLLGRKVFVHGNLSATSLWSNRFPLVITASDIR